MSSLTRRVAVATACLTLPVTLAACGQSAKTTGSAASSATSVASSATSSSSSASSKAAAGASSSSSSSTTSSQAASGSSSSSAAAAAPAGSVPSGSTMQAVTPATTVSTLSPAHTAPQGGAAATSKGKGAQATSGSRPTGGSAATGTTATGATATQQLNAQVSGRTITYSVSVNGTQHPFQAVGGPVMSYDKPATMVVSFGDGNTEGIADAGMQCTTKGAVSPFSAKLAKSHTYAKPGTYTVTVRTTYCADAGATTKATTYQVTVR